MNYIQFMSPGGTTEKKKETSKFIEWLNKAGKSWKDFWDKPVTIQYAYNPHAVVGNGGAPFSSTQRRGDFATQAAGALAVPATAVGIATVGVPATAVGMGVGIGAGAAGSAGGSKLIELVGGDKNAQEMVGDIAGFTLGTLAGGKATKTYNSYSNLMKSSLDPKSIYTAMSEAMAPVKTSSAGIWTNRGTRSAKISEAERLGIPKGDRNKIIVDRGEMLDKKFRWVDGKLVPEYTYDPDAPPAFRQVRNWDISDGKPFTDAAGKVQYKFRPRRDPEIDYTKMPIANWGDDLKSPLFMREDPTFGWKTPRTAFQREGGLNTEDIKMSKILKNVASKLKVSNDLIKAFDNNVVATRFRQYYWNKGYSLNSNLTQRDIAKIVAENYAQLTNTQSGKLKNLILWNGSPEIQQYNPQTKQFTLLREGAPDQFSIINNGYRTSHFDRPGIYFNTQPTQYDHAIVTTNQNFGSTPLIQAFPKKVAYSVTPGDKQPYLINNVKNVIRGDLPTSLNTTPKNTVLHTSKFKGTRNAYTQDPLNGDEFFTTDIRDIKGLFPHPNLFVENPDGTWSMVRSWNTPGLHFKSGGKLNYLNLMNNGMVR